jgi:hypothetical protein
MKLDIAASQKSNLSIICIDYRRLGIDESPIFYMHSDSHEIWNDNPMIITDYHI